MSEETPLKVRLTGPFVTAEYKEELIARAATKKGGSIGKELEIDRVKAKSFDRILVFFDGLDDLIAQGPESNEEPEA